MLTKRIIPCLDCKDGRVVKGIQFNNLVDSGDPAELAKKYEEELADEIIVLDVSATLEERKNQKETIKNIRKNLSIPLTVGGGVKSLEDFEQLLISGADKVAINSAAVADPKLIYNAAKIFGSQCVVLAIDVKKDLNSWRVFTRSGTTEQKLDAIAWSKEVFSLGAGEILLTSMDKDGTKSGYDLELIYEISRAVDIPVIASGGARNAEDFKDAFMSGADAVLAASIFHFGDTTVRKVKEELSKFNIFVRN